MGGLKINPPRWGFPKIKATLLEVDMRRIIVYWDPLILGNYHTAPNRHLYNILEMLNYTYLVFAKCTKQKKMKSFGNL